MRYTALRVETLDPHGFSLLLLQHLKAAVRCLALLLLLMLSFAGVAVDTVTAASWHSVQMYEPLRPVDPTIVISIAQVPTLTDFAASKKARLEVSPKGNKGDVLFLVARLTCSSRTLHH